MSILKVKVRSLKQALHWLFLAVGAVAVAGLLITVSTYIGYARDGYGLDVSVSAVEVSGPKLYLTISVDNPGKLDMNAWGWGNVSLGDGASVYNFYIALNLEAEKATSAVVSVDLSQEDSAALYAGGTVDVSMFLSVEVPERDVVTHLSFWVDDLEVGT